MLGGGRALRTREYDPPRLFLATVLLDFGSTSLFATLLSIPLARLWAHASSAPNNPPSAPTPTKRSSTSPSWTSCGSTVNSGGVVPSKVAVVGIGLGRRSTTLLSRCGSGHGAGVSAKRENESTEDEMVM